MAGLVRGRARGEGGRLGRRLALEREAPGAPRRGAGAELRRCQGGLWPLWAAPMDGPLWVAPMGGPYC
eukprot:scaffold23945_cov18-Phaeocystis_antarctica.AAC.1